MRLLEDYNPIVVAVYFFAVAGVAMFSMNPALLALSLLGSLLFYFSRSGTRNFASHLWLLGLFAVLVIVNPLVSHNGVTVLFVLNGNPVTLEATIYGLAAAVMILSVLYWFRSFSEIMTSERLLYLMGGLSPKLALVLSMGLRYVPLFVAEAGRIRRAQTAIGLYKDDNAIDRMRGGGRIFSILVTWALENGIVTADSMAARGWGIGRRTHFSIFRFRRADAVLLSTVLLLFAVTAVGIGTDALDFTYYPAIVPGAVSPLAVAGIAAYGILILIPTILEAEEAVKWTCLRSKI